MKTSFFHIFFLFRVGVYAIIKYGSIRAVRAAELGSRKGMEDKEGNLINICTRKTINRY